MFDQEHAHASAGHHFGQDVRRSARSRRRRGRPRARRAGSCRMVRPGPGPVRPAGAGRWRSRRRAVQNAAMPVMATASSWRRRSTRPHPGGPTTGSGGCPRPGWPPGRGCTFSLTVSELNSSTRWKVRPSPARARAGGAEFGTCRGRATGLAVVGGDQAANGIEGAGLARPIGADKAGDGTGGGGQSEVSNRQRPAVSEPQSVRMSRPPPPTRRGYRHPGRAGWLAGGAEPGRCGRHRRRTAGGRPGSGPGSAGPVRRRPRRGC